MAYTSADLDAIDRAILALASGARVTQVTFADGRTLRYTEAQLRELRELRDWMAPKIAPIGHDPALMAGGVTYAEWTRD